MNKVIKFAFIICTVLNFVGCERTSTITHGEFNGLNIGMTKDAAALSLAKHGIRVVEPVVKEQIDIGRNNLDEISRLEENNGICISGRPGYVIHVFVYANGKTKVLYSSATASEDSLIFKGLNDKNEVLEKIKKLIEEDPNIHAKSCVLDPKFIHVFGPSPIDMENMKKYDKWFYYVPNSYSTAILYFDNNKLRSIEYTYRRYETP